MKPMLEYDPEWDLPGCSHAVVLRSPHTDVRFHGARAHAMPGVALVLGGADTAALGNLPCQNQGPPVCGSA
jgi:aerobic carbon-monoxide dehydrogenase large subunit